MPLENFVISFLKNSQSAYFKKLLRKKSSKLEYETFKNWELKKNFFVKEFENEGA